MKRFLIPLALLLTAVGCVEREAPFVVEGDPYFNITIRDDSEVPIAELDEMSAQYSFVLGPNAWSASENKNNHVSKAPRFYVNSNMRWKVVPASPNPGFIPSPKAARSRACSSSRQTATSALPRSVQPCSTCWLTRGAASSNP